MKIRVLHTDQDATAVPLLEIKDHLRIDHTLQDDLLTRLAVACTQQVETECYTLLSPATVTVFYDIPRYKGDLAALSYNTLIDVDKIHRQIKLPKTPVRSVSSVEFVKMDGSLVDVDQELYYFEEETGYIRWKDGYFSIADTPADGIYNEIKITYEAGYETGEVPEDIKHAVKIIAADIYENPDSQTDVIYIPKKASWLLRRYRTARLAG